MHSPFRPTMTPDAGNSPHRARSHKVTPNSIAKAHAAARAAHAAGRAPPAWATTATVRVRLHSNANTVLTVPLLHVSHMPAATPEAGPSDVSLTLCRYSEAGAPAPCPNGPTCPFVHADVSAATEYLPHDRGAAAVGAYACFPPGHTVTVMFPGRQSVAVASEHLLQTRALVGVRRAVGACEHFVTKGHCRRGAECTFAHPVPDTATVRSAPGSPISPTTCHLPMPTGNVQLTTFAPLAGTTDNDSPVLLPGAPMSLEPSDNRARSSMRPLNALDLSQLPDASFHDDRGAESDRTSVAAGSCASDERAARDTATSAVAASSTPRPGSRLRHDPYSAQPRRVTPHTSLIDTSVQRGSLALSVTPGPLL